MSSWEQPLRAKAAPVKKPGVAKVTTANVSAKPQRLCVWTRESQHFRFAFIPSYLESGRQWCSNETFPTTARVI